MSEQSQSGPSAETVEEILRGELAHGDVMLATAPPILRHIVDAALLGLGVLAIDSLAHRALFPPVVLVAGLLLLDRSSLHPALEPLRDRGIVAAAISVLSALISPEIAIMFAASLILLAKLLPQPAQSG